MRNFIETWIHEHLDPIENSTAQMRYKGWSTVAGDDLLEIYAEPDCRKIYHWRDTALCSAFVSALACPNGKILDVGPGDGWPALIIAPYFRTVVGIDPVASLVETQKQNAVRMQRTNCEFLQMDVKSLEFPDETFDGVVAASSIEQSGDPVKALREIFRVLKPGRRLVMTYENYDYFDRPGGESENIEGVVISEKKTCIFYNRCTKEPPREVEYGIFLNPDGIRNDNLLLKTIKAMKNDGEAWLNQNDLTAFLVKVQPFYLRTEYFELKHLTRCRLNRILCDIGYEEISGFDGTVGGVTSFFQVSKEMEILEKFSTNFRQVSQVFAKLAIQGLTDGANDFTIAHKPSVKEK